MMTGSSTDADVIQASRQRPDDFAVIFDRHHRAIFRFLANRVGPDVAESLASEVFVIAFRQRATYEPAYDSALPWLYGIANRLVSNHRRSEQRQLRILARSTGVAVTPYADDEAGVLDRVWAEQLHTAVANALAKLPTEQRDAFLLFAWGDLSYSDIARAANASVGTVSSRINRARRSLQRTLLRHNEGAQHG